MSDEDTGEEGKIEDELEGDFIHMGDYSLHLMLCYAMTRTR